MLAETYIAADNGMWERGERCSPRLLDPITYQESNVTDLGCLRCSLVMARGLQIAWLAGDGTELIS